MSEMSNSSTPFLLTPVRKQGNASLSKSSSVGSGCQSSGFLTRQTQAVMS